MLNSILTADLPSPAIINHMRSLVLTTQIYAPSGVHPNRQRDAQPPPTLQEGTYTGQTCLIPLPTVHDVCFWNINCGRQWLCNIHINITMILPVSLRC